MLSLLRSILSLGGFRHLPGLACLALLAAAGTVQGQEVRGRVVDEGSDVGVAGAAVLLLREDGTRARAVLADAAGRFSLRAPEPGRYRVRAEMIGRRTVEVGVAVSDTMPFLTVAMPVHPIELTGLAVAAASRCRAGDETVRETHVVWEEAQKALRAEAITREQALFQFLVARYQRRLDRSAREVESEEVEYIVQIRDDPFETLPPDVLAREGYVHTEEGATYVYGPNTNVFLSEGFQNTHCFALRRDAERPGQIGLVFEPIAGRRLPDIGGVLWLDEASAELRELEYRYHHMPRALARGEYSGFAAFHRMPGGGWIIRRWHIRSPVPGYRNRVAGYFESAGVVEEIARIIAEPTLPRVRLRTAVGDIVVIVDSARAPLTAGHFLHLVDAGAYDGGLLRRLVGAADPLAGAAGIALVRGTRRAGSEPAPPAITLEGTVVTGIPHLDGTISMARGSGASAEAVFIAVSEQPSLDEEGRGFVAFGRVIEGMDVVRRIHAGEEVGVEAVRREGADITTGEVLREKREGGDDLTAGEVRQGQSGEREQRDGGKRW